MNLQKVNFAHCVSKLMSLADTLFDSVADFCDFLTLYVCFIKKFQKLFLRFLKMTVQDCITVAKVGNTVQLVPPPLYIFGCDRYLISCTKLLRRLCFCFFRHSIISREHYSNSRLKWGRLFCGLEFVDYYLFLPFMTFALCDSTDRGVGL